MSPKTKAAIVHILVVAGTVATLVGSAAAVFPKVGIPAGVTALIAAVAAAVTAVVQWGLGYFGAAQPPNVAEIKKTAGKL